MTFFEYIMNRLKHYQINKVVILKRKFAYEISWEIFKDTFNKKIQEFPSKLINMQFHTDDPNIYFEFEAQGYDYRGSFGCDPNKMGLYKREKVTRIKKELTKQTAKKLFDNAHNRRNKNGI